MSRSPSPVGISPLTREVQFDEKWSFVAKKEKNRDPDDPVEDRKGDAWDHVAIDAESRLVPCVAPGKRTAENVVAVVEDVKRRTGGRLLDLITTDGYPAYAEAILNAYGETITPPRSGKRGRPWVPYKTAPAGLTYAVVEKTREGPGGRDRHPGGLRRNGRRDGGSWDVAREPSDQHVVPGAAKRHRQAPQRPEGSQDAPILERLAMS